MAGGTTVASLKVAVSADTTAAESGLTALGKTMGKLGPLALGAVALGAVVVGVGVAALHMAGDFQAGMTTLVTGAGESEKNIGLVSKAILQMAIDTGTSTQQLTDGMFMIESAGYHGAAGLVVLKAAAEGAKVGNADLGTVADAVTTIMKDYADTGVTAAQATNLLIATVASGKTHMEDLAGSIATVLPAASKFGVSLSDVMAAMATMTSHGIAAANAATYLRQMIVSLEAPTAAGAKALKSVGLTAQEVSDDIKKNGLGDALRMITEAIRTHLVPGSTEALTAFKEIAGGSRQMQGMLALTGTSLREFYADAQALGGVVGNTSSKITGWALVQQTFNYKLSVAKETIAALMIELGEKLLPVGTRFVSWIVGSAIPAITRFITMIQGSSKEAQILRPLLIILGIVIAGVLAGAFIAWAVAAAAAAVATIAATWPVLAIGVAIALLVAGLIWAYKNWGWFRTGVDGARVMMQNTITVIGDILGWIGPRLTPAVQMAGRAFQTFGQIINTIRGWIQDLINTIRGIAGAVGGAINSMQNLGNVASGIGNAVGNAMSHIPGFASGGTMPDTGLALVGEQGPELLRLPGGTQITPMDQLRVGGGGNISGLPGGMQRMPQMTATGQANGQPLHVHLYVDKHQLATAVVQGIPGVVRQSTGTRAF
jgi:TP901 family phage tail tape measure protein